MKHSYERPELQCLNHVAFETVCAGSGGVMNCPFGRTSVAQGSNTQCQPCLGENVPSLRGLVGKELDKAVKLYLRTNPCPAGFWK